VRLRRLRVDRLPGIHPGFELTDIAPGVNVVVGPNASGKSSVLRAVQALLYPEEQRGAGVILEAVFEDGSGELRVSRVGDATSWTRDGRAVPRPALPEHHLLGCYTLGVEELTAAGATDALIARQLALELSGGYDLTEVRERGPFRGRGSGQSEAKRLQRATEALNAVLREREQLVQQEEQIERWLRQEREAEAAAHDADDHDRALGLIEARRDVERVRAELDDFPEGMERLVGGEAERLHALHSEIEASEAELAAARRRDGEAARTLETSGLEPSALKRSDLEERAQLLKEMQREASELAALEDRRGEAQAELELARSALGPQARPDPGPKLDPVTLSAVDAALEAKRSIEAELRELRHELDRLPTPDDGEEPPERLKAARDALAAWLAAAHGPRWTAARGLGLALVLGGGGGVLALAFLGGAQTLPLAGLAGALLAGLLLLLRDGAATRERVQARERFRRSGLDAPEPWGAPGVSRRLDALETAVARAEGLRTQLEQRAEAERRRAAALARQAEAERVLGELAERVGFDPAALDAGLERWLRLVDAVDRAEVKLRAIEARRTPRRQRIDASTAALRTFLDEHGETVDEPAPPVAWLESRWSALSQRLTMRDDARKDRDGARAAIEHAERDLERARGAVRTLLAGAGLDSGEGEAALRDAERELHRRLARLDAYRQRSEALRDAVLRERDRRQALAHRPDLLERADADDADGLRARLAELRQSAAAAKEISERIAVTRERVRRAGTERDLERAHQERQEAADALADRLDEALYAEAGAFLLDTVETEHEQTSQPDALRRAASWFRRFTRDQYELLFDGGRQGEPAARETASGERRSLTELSTGTRAQLLLAVRVAFATESERGRASLPLFLDEALTTADVDRFRAVGRSLSVLAREGGRQLFYLTARPEDALLWDAPSERDAVPPAHDGAAAERDGAPHLIDIARVRRLGGAVSGPEALALPAHDDLPAPDGATPEAYGAALGVPPVDPWRPGDTCHLFHLLRDDLPLLHRLLRAGVERLGTLRAFLRGDGAHALLTGAERTRLEARAAAMDPFLEGWRRGRGRPVDRAALEASDAVTATFLDRVDDLSARVGGDARRLLEGLEEGQVARFRNEARDQLKDWLLDHGYLDDRPVLDEAGLRQRLLEALAQHGTSSGAEGVDAAALLDEADRLTRWWSVAVGAGGPFQSRLTTRRESSANPSRS
jgi:DNA repair exonuclease SbcCD ATPase subunit